VRGGENDEGIEQIGVVQGKGPGGGGTPVMTDEDEALMAKLCHQSPDVLRRGPGTVVTKRLGLGGEIVAAQVGGDGKVVDTEISELVAPHVPALREAVQEDDQGTGTNVGVVKPNPVEVCVVVGDLGVSRRADRILLV
jgi:hypothetical protein